jgi:hypothetical protein
MVRIDLSNTYEFTDVSLDRENTKFEFFSPQSDGIARLMRVEIKPYPDPLLPLVCNLAMGPLTKTGEIDDQTRLKHQDRVVVYSTLVFCMLGFLNKYPDLMVGLDGSNDSRAAIYHGIFLANRNYLNDYFVPIGVDWFVKLLRNKRDVERNPEGEPFFKPMPERFNYKKSRHELYRYYLVQLKR